MEHLWSDRERQWLSLLRQCRSGCVVGEEPREPSPDRVSLRLAVLPLVRGWSERRIG